MKNNNLDDLEYYKKADPSNMLGHIHDIPSLCHKAWSQTQCMALPRNYAISTK
jgi:hypothetical protein